jgi:hypothetical protein
MNSPEDVMNIRNNTTTDLRAIKLEQALADLPHKELPSHVGQRILAAVRERSVRQIPAARPLSQFQWALLSAGMAVFLFGGVLLARSVPPSANEQGETITGYYDLDDHGLLELYR